MEAIDGEDFQREWELSDEELKKLKANPNCEKIYENRHRLKNSRIMATIVKTKNCTIHNRGDKFVFNGMGQLIVEESAHHPCMFALSQLSAPLNLVFNEIIMGTAKNGPFTYTRCTDVGPDAGGYGFIVMRLHVELSN